MDSRPSHSSYSCLAATYHFPLALQFHSYFCDRNCNKNRIGKPGNCSDGDCNEEEEKKGNFPQFLYSKNYTCAPAMKAVMLVRSRNVSE